MRCARMPNVNDRLFCLAVDMRSYYKVACCKLLNDRFEFSPTGDLPAFPVRHAYIHGPFAVVRVTAAGYG